MTILTRRGALGTVVSAATAGILLGPASPALAQGAGPALASFRFEDVVRRARDLAAAPFDGALPPLPEAIANLDFDAYRDIRFRPERSFLAQAGSPVRLQLFHLGFLYRRPVIVNVIRDGVPNPIPYQQQLFDYGRTKIERALPINLGFAGFRIHYALNSPRVLDELIAFLGASYFRVLGRDQKYGLSARGLAVGVGGREPEEFPFFREFWIEGPQPGADRISIHALLDSAAVTGAFRFDVYPAHETEVEVNVSLFPRRQVTSVGLAPLTSMFFAGENERRTGDDFRPELHDSDGLLLHSGSGEWLWRPLRNPQNTVVSVHSDQNPRGFGLMQRDRMFESYQDLEASYHQRPSYWIEPIGSWGEGRVELVEIPTNAEVHDNVVAYWTPNRPLETGQEVAFAYRLKAMGEGGALHPGGKVLNTFGAPARASGSPDPADRGLRRFLVDFAGGNLAYYLVDPSLVQVVATASNAQVVSTSLVPNEHTGGFRAALDVRIRPGQSTDLRAFLKAGERALTETWTYPWSAE